MDQLVLFLYKNSLHKLVVCITIIFRLIIQVEVWEILKTTLNPVLSMST